LARHRVLRPADIPEDPSHGLAKWAQSGKVTRFGRKKMAGWFSRQGTKMKDYSAKVVGAEEIRNNHQIMRDSISRLLSWRRREVREETFANAVARLKMDEATIRETQQQFVYRFYLFLGLMLVNVLFMAWSIAEGSWASLMPGLGFFALCLSQLFIASFRAYQISRRELVGVGQWWKDPDAWWPAMPASLPQRPGPGTPGKQATRQGSRSKSSPR
jgi:hypothetical protein